MNTPHDHNHTDTTAAADEHWWPRLADRINHWWIHREKTLPALADMLAIPPKRATAAILATIALAITLVGLLVWWMISGIVGVITGITTAIAGSSADAAKTGAHDLASWSLTRTITEPVRAFLDQHSGGLPVGAGTLWLTWLATTGALFLLAALGSRGARIGWTLTGATTTAMVYTATPPTGRLVAAGLALTIWAVLSVIALNRVGTHGRAVHITLPFPRRPRLSDADTDD